jgi:hypothetical protein
MSMQRSSVEKLAKAKSRPTLVGRGYLTTSLSTFDQFVQKPEQVAKVRGQPSLDLGTRPLSRPRTRRGPSSSRAYLGPSIWLYPTRSPEI